MDLRDIAHAIAESYTATKVDGWCARCRKETIHLKATSTVPITGETCMTLECQTCFISQTTIIQTKTSEEN